MENEAYSPHKMSGEEKFWVKVWGMVIIGMVCIAISVSSCTMYGKYKIAEVIKTGVDPIEARLAIEDGMTSEVITSILTKNKK